MQTQILNVSFSDPIGVDISDFFSTDLVRMDFTFEQSSGNFTIDLYSTPENPFRWSFSITVALYNPDVGTTDPDPSLFVHPVTEGSHFQAVHFTDVEPTTKLSLSGVNSRLKSWNVGDRVAISGPEPLGLPDGFSGFNTYIFMDPLKVDFMESSQAVITAIPEPGPLYCTLLLSFPTLCYMGFRKLYK